MCEDGWCGLCGQDAGLPVPGSAPDFQSWRQALQLSAPQRVWYLLSRALGKIPEVNDGEISPGFARRVSSSHTECLE